MKDKKGLKNLLFGFLGQFITIALGILIPRLVLVNLGSESNGLLSAIGSVLGYLALLEAGVGTATIQALYKPIGTGDRLAVNRIMAATHRYYRRTGMVYFACVAVLSVAFTVLIEASLPRYQIFLVVFLAGMSGVINYFFQAKLRLLLTAEGKSYIISNVNTAFTVMTSLLRIAILVLGGNVVFVQGVHFVVNLLQMLFYATYFRRRYQWLDLTVEPDFAAISQKNAVLVHQISGMVFNNTDVLVLTALTNLNTVSVYSMFAMIFGMIKSVAVMINESFTYKLGQTFHDRTRFIPLFDLYETVNMSITFALFCIGQILMIPFVRLYTAGVSDIDYVDPMLAWLFVIFYLLHNARQPSANVINFAQHYQQTKNRTIIESVLNIASSILLTKIWGVYGVVLGTIIALLYRANDMIIYAARLLERSPWITYSRWLRNIVIFAVCYGASRLIPVELNDYVTMVGYGIALLLVILPVFVGLNLLVEQRVRRTALDIWRQIGPQRSKQGNEPGTPQGD